MGAVVRFFERSVKWWTVFESQMQRPELQALEAQYNERIARLRAAALGHLIGADRLTNATVDALIHPATLGALIWVLQSSGLSLDEVVEVAGNLVVPIVMRAQVAPGKV